MKLFHDHTPNFLNGGHAVVIGVPSLYHHMLEDIIL